MVTDETPIVGRIDERALLDELVDWTVPAVAAALAISQRHALRLLRANAEHFDPPRYRKFRRWIRVLTPQEARRLKGLLGSKAAPRRR